MCSKSSGLLGFDFTRCIRIRLLLVLIVNLPVCSLKQLSLQKIWLQKSTSKTKYTNFSQFLSVATDIVHSVGLFSI